jgi:hypothetical protein
MLHINYGCQAATRRAERRKPSVRCWTICLVVWSGLYVCVFVCVEQFGGASAHIPTGPKWDLCASDAQRKLLIDAINFVESQSNL